jgi:hypothetical protein
MIQDRTGVLLGSPEYPLPTFFPVLQELWEGDQQGSNPRPSLEPQSAVPCCGVLPFVAESAQISRFTCLRLPTVPAGCAHGGVSSGVNTLIAWRTYVLLFGIKEWETSALTSAPTIPGAHAPRSYSLRASSQGRSRASWVRHSPIVGLLLAVHVQHRKLGRRCHRGEAHLIRSAKSLCSYTTCWDSPVVVVEAIAGYDAYEDIDYSRAKRTIKKTSASAVRVRTWVGPGASGAMVTVNAALSLSPRSAVAASQIAWLPTTWCFNTS